MQIPTGNYLAAAIRGAIEMNTEFEKDLHDIGLTKEQIQALAKTLGTTAAPIGTSHLFETTARTSAITATQTIVSKSDVWLTKETFRLLEPMLPPDTYSYDSRKKEYRVAAWAHEAAVKIANERRAALAEEEKKKKGRAFVEWASGNGTLMGEHGRIFLPNPTITLLQFCRDNCKPVLLVGEPATAKTDTTRALTGERLHFHMDVTGISDVQQMEAERIIRNEGGVSVTDFRPSAMLQAIKAAADGKQVQLDIQEIARVLDASCLNPLLHLMSHDEYPCLIEGIVYKVPKGNLWIVATANLDPRYNFSGNVRRGLDDALIDRFTMVQLARPDSAVVQAIMVDRGYKKDYAAFWELASREANYSVVLTLRRLFEIANVVESLDWSIAFACAELLRPRFRNEAHFTSFIAAVEALGL